MKVKKEIVTKASKEKVWDIIGTNYGEAAVWVSSVSSSEMTGEPKIDGAPCGGRVCETSIGQATESIEVFDPKNHRLSYTAQAKKMPFFVKQLRADWTIDPTQADLSKIGMTLSVDMSFPFNFLMSLPMKMQFSKIIGEALEELKHYAETGSPHPRKVKVQQQTA